MNLSELEKAFASAVFSKQPSIDITKIARSVLPHGGLSAEQRIGIYRNSAHGILCNHLIAIYAVTLQLLGKERFMSVCSAYIDQYPPSNMHLADYGETLIGYLDQHPILEENQWITCIAKLEWARHAAWHGANQLISDFSVLGGMNDTQQGSIQFHLPKSAHLLSLSVPADDVWLAHQSESIETITAALSRVNLADARFLIVWRCGRSLEQARLIQQEHHFLHHASSGKSLKDLADIFGEDVSRLLSRAVEKGWIISFS